MSETLKFDGRKLRTLRRAADLTQVELAEEIGMTSEYISMLERGALKNPSVKALAKIAKVLEVGIDEFFHEDGNRRADQKEPS